MASDKKTIVDCPESIDVGLQDSCGQNIDCGKQRSRKKRLIVTLTLLGLLICLALAATVVIGFWASKIKLQEKEHKTIGDKEVDQELYQDATDSLTVYHIVDGSTETWFILDLNREIIVMKLNSGDALSSCYVKPFDPSTISEQNLTTTTSTTTTSSQVTESPSNQSVHAVTVRTSGRPIKEKSMLGKRGQELCKDVDTFWILSSSDASGGSSGDDVRTTRVRRATYSYYTCFFDWTRCSYFSFPDKPYMQYYSCQWTCGLQTVNY